MKVSRKALRKDWRTVCLLGPKKVLRWANAWALPLVFQSGASWAAASVLPRGVVLEGGWGLQ